MFLWFCGKTNYRVWLFFPFAEYFWMLVSKVGDWMCGLNHLVTWVDVLSGYDDKFRLLKFNLVHVHYIFNFKKVSFLKSNTLIYPTYRCRGCPPELDPKRVQVKVRNRLMKRTLFFTPLWSSPWLVKPDRAFPYQKSHVGNHPTSHRIGHTIRGWTETCSQDRNRTCNFRINN